MDAVAQCLGAGGLNEGKPVAQHGREDCYHLTVAIVDGKELAHHVPRVLASHGIALYRVVESLGATEGAPAAGTADLIVDITTTGATLAANHLKILDDGVILRSQANLAASHLAEWSDDVRSAFSMLASALAGAGIKDLRGGDVQAPGLRS